MIQVIEIHRAGHGGEPIYRVLPMATAMFSDHWAKRAAASRLVDRAFEENLKVEGVRKVWHPMLRGAG